MMRPKPSPMGSAMPRPPTPAASTKPHGTSSVSGLSSAAEPQTVALYLGHLAADGKAIATIAQARAAISHAHAAQGIPMGDNPARHPVVAETMKGWRNQAPAPKQADALTTDALARLPRPGHGGAWSQQPSHRPGAPSTWQSSE